MIARSTVLVVDDDTSVRRLCRRLLEESGFQVVEAVTETEVRRALGSSGPISVLITEVEMPTMNGLTLVQSLLADHPRLPVLYICSGTSDGPRLERHCAEFGCRCLQKPFGRAALLGSIQQLLEFRGEVSPQPQGLPKPV